MTFERNPSHGADELRPAPCAPRLLARRALETVRPDADERGITLDGRVDAAVPEQVVVDAEILGTMLQSLLTTFVRTHRGGLLELDVSISHVDDRRPRLRFGAWWAGPGRASTGDEPAAVSEELERLQSLVHRLGGSVGVEHVPGRGMGLWFSLDVTRPEAGASAAESAGGRGRTRVLVVDDLPLNRRVASAILESLDCDVTHADGGLEACELALHDRFDLVFMDCHMPGLDGFEATRRIRASGRGSHDRPIVALTAAAQPEHERACLASGMDGVLYKPASRDDFVAALARWAPAWRARAAED